MPPEGEKAPRGAARTGMPEGQTPDSPELLCCALTSSRSFQVFLLGSTSLLALSPGENPILLLVEHCLCLLPFCAHSQAVAAAIPQCLRALEQFWEQIRAEAPQMLSNADCGLQLQLHCHPVELLGGIPTTTMPMCRIFPLT